MKRFTAALLVLLLLFAGARPVSATAPSESHYQHGVAHLGVILANRDRPIVVEHTLLTFDLQEFPQSHYESEEEFLTYSSRVTAEYTLYNPSDMTVTAKLLLPCNAVPQYGILDNSETGDAITPNAEQYHIQVNGEMVEKQLRPTVSADDSYLGKAYLLSSNYTHLYEYEIILEPGQRVINTVSAPIYPYIDEDYAPGVYDYIYSLLPEQAWQSFGALEIVINTPYSLIQGSPKGYEKTETGYKLSLDGAPSSYYSLHFSLSSSENPERIEPEGFNWAWIVILAAPFLMLFEAFEAIGEFFTNLFQNLF